MVNTVTTSIAGKQITIETGRLAKQTDGSVLVTCGNNVVLVTAVSSKEAKPDQSFFPLTVEFIEKYYAIGKIPGGYFKREGKPSNDSVLSARIVDRPIRPLFPEGYLNDTQVVATVLSADGSFSMDVLAALGASAALHISNIPFAGPTAACHVARVNGQFIANPTPEQIATSDMDILVSGTKNGLLMVEGEAKFISEADALAALKFGHQSLMPLLQMQEELREKTGSVAKRAFTPATIDADFRTQAENLITPLITKALSQKIKQDRYAGFDVAKEAAVAAFVAPLTDDKLKGARKKEIAIIIEDIKYKVARSQILDTASRIDGRDLKTVRPIMCEVGLLPRAHGSGLFQRGETQCLGTVTLGTADDEQTVETLNGTVKRKFSLHYNFPPYSVGEVGRFGGQGRREIGHGNLAERSVKAVAPDHAQFPYTIRIVAEVLESNGSSSMGSVCAATLAMLDAGIKIKANIAGIAMGLIKEGDRVAVLSDILGDEDHLGDMDFKVAGSSQGITALQMDIKIDSVSFAVMETALNQAKDGRLFILGEMEKVMKAPRGQMSEFAPRIETIKIKVDKIREVIGSGGKVIRSITEQTGVKIEIQDDGTINIASSDPAATKKAIAIIESICAEAEVGKTYKGKVMKIAEFGAFVEILPNTQGLLHISELANERVRQVTDVLKEGEMIDVKVLEVDRSGRIKLSRKALMQ
ncbi:MAG: polyribonucleotide nucleotidyltransferase [Bdellovibrionota bacterium]